MNHLKNSFVFHHQEEQIKLREQENDLVKEQCLDLDKQVDNLRTSIDEFEQIGVKSTHIELRERINALSDEVDNLKSVKWFILNIIVFIVYCSYLLITN